MWKGCSGTNPSYAELAYFLHQIQFPEEIPGVYLPAINAVVAGGSSDNVISSGTSDAEIEPVTTKIVGSNGLIQNIPTADFKTILEEYSAFLHTRPLNGTTVR